MSDDIPAMLLRWTGENFSQAVAPEKQPRRFIKGPLPLPWMLEAMKLPGKTTQIALAIWYLAGLTKSNHVKLSPKVVRLFGVSRDAQYDAVARLEGARLIAVTRAPGSALEVTILDFE